MTTTLLPEPLQELLMGVEMLDQETGRLRARLLLPSTRRYVPAHVELDEGEAGLVWSNTLPGQRGAREASMGGPVDSTGMLDAFIRLRDANGVLRFARRYGVLEICEQHELPSSHNPRPRFLLEPDKEDRCRPKLLDKEARVYWEPVKAWLSLARKAWSVLCIAARVHTGEPGTKDDWHTIFEDAADKDIEGLSSDIDRSRLFLGFVADRWLDVGNVHLSFNWTTLDPTTELRVGTFGELAVQLATAVARKHGFAVCDGCGTPYPRERKPQRGRRNYCRRCRELGIDNRNRQRDHRARKGESNG